MRLEFDGEQALLQATARDFAVRELEPFLARHPDEPLPRDSVLELLRMVKPFGMLSARVPDHLGGAGMDAVSLGILYEEFPPDVSLTASANDIIGLRLLDGGSPELVDRYLPRLIEGEIMAGSSISEPDAGSDVTSITTRAEAVGDSYVVDGRKVWSSHCTIADILLAAVRLGTDDRGRAVVGRLLIDREQSRFETRDLELMGLRRHHLGEVVFDGCRVPAGNLIGEGGLASLTASWLTQRTLLGLMAVHLARKAYDASVAYARERRQFGKPIGAFQLVQSMIVEMATLIDTSRYLCYRALDLLDRGVEARLESSMAKYYATEAAVKVTSLAIQVHGAYGLSTEYPLEQYFRDARMLTMPDGTTEIQKLMVGREILGISAIR